MRLHLLPREARICGHGLRTAGWDLLAHEAPAAGQKRARIAGWEAAQLPTAGTLSSTGGGCADGRRARRHGGAGGARGGRKERGPAGRGRGRGTVGEETSPSADETRYGRLVHCHAPTLQPLSRNGTGQGINRCLAQVADHHGAAAWRQRRFGMVFKNWVILTFCALI